MRFIINNLIYETEEMEKMAEGQKWRKVSNIWTQAMFPGKEVGREIPHTLWRSESGRWLFTWKNDYSNFGEAIEESEAKEFLKHNNYKKYVELFGELPKA